MPIASEVHTDADSLISPARRRVLYHHDTYPLGPLDQPVAAHIPVAAIFVYPAKDGQSLINAEPLRHATSLVLDYYPFLAGRLQRNKNGAHNISDFDTGAVFTKATCQRQLSDYRPALRKRLNLADLPSDGNALLLSFDPADVYGQPVLSIQHTTFACGGVSLGIRILHKVVDALGYFMFVRHLLEVHACITTGTEIEIHRPPSLCAYDPARHSPRADDSDVAIPPYFIDAEHTSLTRAGTDVDAPITVTGRFLRVSLGALDSLKREASLDDMQTSTFVALTSFLYQSIHRARIRLRQHEPSIAPLPSTHYLTSVDVRRLLHLAEYPHNAIITPSTAIPQHNLACGPLHTVASAIRGMIQSSLNAEAVEGTARWISAQEDKGQMRTAFEYGPGAFMTSAWNRIDMYGKDFHVDGAAPALVSTPFTPISLVDGLAYFLPLSDGADGLEVCLALDERVWPWLDESEEWARVFGTDRES